LRGEIMKGEFEERITQNEGNGRVIHSDLLRDWVDQAKKEYLAIEEADTSQYSEEDFKWFEKWFGKR